MPGWKDDYLSSLLEAERNNPVNFDLVEACSHLNDRIACLEAEKAQRQSAPASSSSPPSAAAAESAPAPPPPPSSSSSSAPPDLAETLAAAAAASASTSTDPLLLRLRADLARALQQNTSLGSRLRAAAAERDRLAATAKTQARAIASLTAERDALARRVSDRAEELRGKKQMLERVQDEVLALEMQLNVAEQQKAKIAAENKNLIDRWMKRAEMEAREMNAANERGTDAA